MQVSPPMCLASPLSITSRACAASIPRPQGRSCLFATCVKDSDPCSPHRRARKSAANQVNDSMHIDIPPCAWREMTKSVTASTKTEKVPHCDSLERGGLNPVTPPRASKIPSLQFQSLQPFHTAYNIGLSIPGRHLHSQPSS